MAKRKGSLLLQLTLRLGLAIVFLSLASFFYQFRVQKHIMVSSIRSDLTRQATLLRSWLAQAADAVERERIAHQYIRTLEYLDPAKQTVVVVDEKGVVLASSKAEERGTVCVNNTIQKALEPGAPGEGIHAHDDNEYVVALPCYGDATRTKTWGAVLIRQPLTAVEKLADSLMLWAFIVFAATLVIIVVVVHYVLRVRVHRPMQAIFMQEYRISEGDLAKIEAEDPGNEFSDLYAMYNEMVVRIAEQKKAIIEQKDHVALAQLVRQAIARLTGPLDGILAESRTLMEHESSISEEDRKLLKQIIANITRIARELRSIVMEGDKSATWLKREAEKIPHYANADGESHTDGRHVIG